MSEHPEQMNPKQKLHFEFNSFGSRKIAFQTASLHSSATFESLSQIDCRPAKKADHWLEEKPACLNSCELSDKTIKLKKTKSPLEPISQRNSLYCLTYSL
eukprot:Gregarina_sp_Poly_1__3150@NODE_1892_length_3130_cov_184_804440_g1226_i0_p7_GENE_NODE_1892_length_3130_cov_184_804440_g1226_i0NODE_1892_length_3130_cov_184_804440_g1226_i0_p7_ORF_typecomplete_len100_score9_67_NODE_1892_length_3130_cov_184_804440_g1226_i016021901